jgi:F-type H+-transporting ATPase subunit a
MPFGINVTGNLTITFALVMTFLITNLQLIKLLVIFSGCGCQSAYRISTIELLGVFIKPFSLMIRLCIHFAGHIVLMSIIGLMFIFKSWLGSTLSFGCHFALSILGIGCILTGLYFHCYQRFILVLQ